MFCLCSVIFDSVLVVCMMLLLYLYASQFLSLERVLYLSASHSPRLIVDLQVYDNATPNSENLSLSLLELRKPELQVIATRSIMIISLASHI